MVRDWETPRLLPLERRALTALTEAMFVPFGPGLSPSAREVALREVVDAVQLELGAPDVLLRTAFSALLATLELSPVRYGFGPRRMSDLPLEARIRYVAALDAADSVPLDTWKSVIGMAYFSHPVGAGQLDLVDRLTAKELAAVGAR